jgi:predicted metal-dependent hydrolase
MTRVTADDVDRSVRYGEELIRYRVRHRPERKSGRVAIHVEPDGRVLVDAPENASDKQIRTAVTRRARWIHGHLAPFRLRRAHVLPREYVSGELLLYLGRRYRLKVVTKGETPATVRLWGGYIEVAVPARDPMAVREALSHWYRGRARLVLEERLEALASSLQWIRKAPAMRLQTMKVQWGSCSPAGRLTLNPHLVKAPRECIDYVLLHELCHLKEHNHSQKFYSLLERHLPRWRRKKERLDELADIILNA